LYRNLNTENSKKLDKALNTKIKTRRFVTRQEADAIHEALGNNKQIKKRVPREKDNTSTILKRLDR